MIAELVAALRTEFSVEPQLSFHASVPKTISAPAIVVAPGDPFLSPREAASGLVRERWEILVAVSIKDPEAGLRQMRRMSLRVRKAVNATGGVWEEASGPRQLEGDTGDNSETVVSVNTVSFRYRATEILSP